MSLLSELIKGPPCNASGGGKTKSQIFTGSSTFNVPDNVSLVYVTTVGGGGGSQGGGGSGYGYQSGGNGSSGLCIVQ